MREREVSSNQLQAVNDRQARNKPISLVADLYCRLHQMPKGMRHFFAHEIVPSVFTGEKRSLSEDSKKLLNGSKVEVFGSENIPKSGPVVFVANHWSGGPVYGNWTYTLISREVARAREDASKDIRWIVNGDASVPVSGLPLPFSSRFIRKFANTYSMHVVGSDDRASGFKIRDSFKRGELIGLFPEQDWTKTLQEGEEASGMLLSALSNVRRDGLVCPVGVYNVDNRNNLYARFGQPFGISYIFEISRPLPRGNVDRTRVYKRVADLLMRRINPLVPPWYRMPEIKK